MLAFNVLLPAQNGDFSACLFLSLSPRLVRMFSTPEFCKGIDGTAEVSEHNCGGQEEEEPDTALEVAAKPVVRPGERPSEAKG